jgi:hypothetical protein
VPLIYKNPHSHSKALAEQELASLEQEHLRIQERLVWIDGRTRQLTEYLRAVTPLIEDDPGEELSEMGLTQICRDVLRDAARWVTAQEMRDMLNAMGIDLSGYTNQMAVLHSILRRIGPSQKDAEGTTYYAFPAKGLCISIADQRSAIAVSTDPVNPQAPVNPRPGSSRYRVVPNKPEPTSSEN